MGSSLCVFIIQPMLPLLEWLGLQLSASPCPWTLLNVEQWVYLGKILVISRNPGRDHLPSTYSVAGITAAPESVGRGCWSPDCRGRSESDSCTCPLLAKRPVRTGSGLPCLPGKLIHALACLQAETGEDPLETRGSIPEASFPGLCAAPKANRQMFGVHQGSPGCGPDAKGLLG